jgi:hypothetical protein
VRDARINRIFEGTNDVLRLFIALTAMDDVGAQLKELAQGVRGALADPIKGFGVLSEYALKHASIRTGLVGEKRSWKLLHPALLDQREQFEEQARELAWVADRVLRRHGKAIVEKQFALRRIADILVDLFVLASVMSRVNSAVEEKGAEGASRELEVLRVFAGGRGAASELPPRGRERRRARHVDRGRRLRARGVPLGSHLTARSRARAKAQGREELPCDSASLREISP